MKAGARVIGVAESYRGTADPSGPTQAGDVLSTLGAAVLRADRVVDGLAFGTCTVGGDDATRSICDLLSTLDREDARYVLVAGIAPAWFNLVDLETVADSVDRPVLSVSFERSPGLEPALRREFDGEALDRRLETYRAQPERTRVDVGEGSLFVRAVGLPIDEARPVLAAVTPAGGRPEPLRVARLAARAADRFRADS